MERAENAGNGGCPQRDSTECEGYAGARSADRPENGERAVRQPNLLESILERENLNNAYKRVKANKGAPGADGMSVEEALPWLKEHGKELTESIRRGKYKPDPVRRKEIPKPDGGVRKLGIPSVKDRIVQQAIAQKLMPIYEPLFADGSYGYRPGRSAQDAIFKIRGYGDEGYEWAVLLDLSKYFDIIEYLDVTPRTFFSEGNENDSLLLQKIVDRLEKHSDDDLSMFLSLLERMDQPKS